MRLRQVGSEYKKQGKRPAPHKRLEGGDKLVLGGAVLTQTASHLDTEAAGATWEILVEPA